MILIYQIIYGLMALLILRCLLEEKGIYRKLTMAILALPFILRAMLIK